MILMKEYYTAITSMKTTCYIWENLPITGKKADVEHMTYYLICVLEKK